MRVMQLWNSVEASTRLVWDRITFSKLTIAYFAFSLVHFAIQLSLQIKAFAINADAASLLRDIVVKGNAFNNSLPILRGDSLFMCSWVPINLDLNDKHCPVVWDGRKGGNMVNLEAKGSPLSVTPSIVATPPGSVTYSASTWPSSDLPSPTSFSSSPSPSLPVLSNAIVSDTFDTVDPSAPTILSGPSTLDDDYGDTKDDYENVSERHELFLRDAPPIFAQQDGETSVDISGMGFEDTNLSSTCLWALNWPVSVLHDTIREDIVFVAFQFWVLVMSIVALLNESIPHTLASLVTHMIATAWAAFQIAHTADFRSNFSRVITNGACSGASLLPSYWRDMNVAEWTSLAFNVLALLVSSFLTWKLFKSFGWQTFKRVGASLTINRIYKIVLTLSITIQLSMFFMAVTVSLWIDQLFNSAIGDLADFETLYKVSSFITLVLLVPWLMTGWVAVRRELRLPMFVFLVLSILYMGGWSVMFFSTTFRWAFVTWRFFSIMAVASVLLTLLSLVLGVVCRYNFGKGLLRYLEVQQKLPDGDFRYYERSEEKVEFPLNEKLIPTFAAAFGQGSEISQPRIFQGPRSFNSSIKYFESGRNSPVTPPPNAYTIARILPHGSSYADDYDSRIMRSNMRSSDQSFGSLVSHYVYSERGHSIPDKQKRWIIE